jgi:hypothetical protein
MLNVVISQNKRILNSGSLYLAQRTLITRYNSASGLYHTLLDVGVYAQPISSSAKLCRISSTNHAAVLVKCSYTAYSQRITAIALN